MGAPFAVPARRAVVPRLGLAASSAHAVAKRTRPPARRGPACGARSRKGSARSSRSRFSARSWAAPPRSTSSGGCSSPSTSSTWPAISGSGPSASASCSPRGPRLARGRARGGAGGATLRVRAGAHRVRARLRAHRAARAARRALAERSRLPMVLASEFGQWMSILVYYVAAISVRQAMTPDRLQGRVNATIRFVAAARCRSARSPGARSAASSGFRSRWPSPRSARCSASCGSWPRRSAKLRALPTVPAGGARSRARLIAWTFVLVPTSRWPRPCCRRRDDLHPPGPAGQRSLHRLLDQLHGRLGRDVDRRAVAGGIGQISTRSLLLFAAAGLIGTVGGRLARFLAIEKVGASVAAAVINLTPLIATRARHRAAGRARDAADRRRHRRDRRGNGAAVEQREAARLRPWMIALPLASATCFGIVAIIRKIGLGGMGPVLGTAIN